MSFPYNGRYQVFVVRPTAIQTFTVGNAVPGVPVAEGGSSARFAGAPHLRNAGDGVPYAWFPTLGQAFFAAQKGPVLADRLLQIQFL